MSEFVDRMFGDKARMRVARGLRRCLRCGQETIGYKWCPECKPVVRYEKQLGYIKKFLKTDKGMAYMERQKNKSRADYLRVYRKRKKQERVDRIANDLDAVLDDRRFGSGLCEHFNDVGSGRA